MSIRSKIFDRGSRVTGAGCLSSKDLRRNGDSWGEFGCGNEWDGGDGVVAHDGGSKVCGAAAGSGSPFPVRAREVAESTGMTAGKSFRTHGSRRAGKNGPPPFRRAFFWARSR